MDYLIGLAVAAAVAALALIAGFDKERSFYATVVVVIATYYILFAVQGATRGPLATEIFFAILFSAAAAIGFRKNLWIVAAAAIGHGVFDCLHHLFIDNPGVPLWWPGFCLSFDALFGCFLAVRLSTRRVRVRRD